MEYLTTVGADGIRFLAELDDPEASRGLKRLPEVEIPRKIWEQQYVQTEGGVRMLDPKEMPEAARRVESPYETEARYSTKGGMNWVGYKVHLTESCDDEDLPKLITNVRTTVATAPDVIQLCTIQEGLAQSELLPAEQLADAGYVCGSNLVSSRAHQIDLIGPPYQDNTWRARAKEGFDVANFRVNWEKKVVSCPRGRESVRCSETKTARGRSMIHVEFPPSECAACPSPVLPARGPGTSHAASLRSRRKSTKPFSRPEGVKNGGVRLHLLEAGGHRRDHLSRCQGLSGCVRHATGA